MTSRQRARIAMREAVTALVADPEVARRGAEIRQDMAKEGGTCQAADIIEVALPVRTA
ncbi:hypothetical protein [Streptomyces sp. NBC_01716]|uniref:hypothetical protein n=1 Tax=Streptomyces sp. NBC_01716 TaxID=2975917 RepID=UPI003FCE3AF7